MSIAKHRSVSNNSSFQIYLHPDDHIIQIPSSVVKSLSFTLLLVRASNGDLHDQRFCLHPRCRSLSQSINNSSANHDHDDVCFLISKEFYNFIAPFSPKFLFRWRRYIKHSRQYLTIFSNTLNFVKNTPLCFVFSTLFLVFVNVFKHGLSYLLYYLKSEGGERLRILPWCLQRTE